MIICYTYDIFHGNNEIEILYSLLLSDRCISLIKLPFLSAGQYQGPWRGRVGRAIALSLFCFG